jgi:hypothetical protein
MTLPRSTARRPSSHSHSTASSTIDRSSSFSLSPIFPATLPPSPAPDCSSPSDSNTHSDQLLLFVFSGKLLSLLSLALSQSPLGSVCLSLSRSLACWLVGWSVPFSTASRDLQDSMFRQQTLNDRDSGAPTHETASPMMRIERSCSWRASLLDLSREDEDIEDEGRSMRKRKGSINTNSRLLLEVKKGGGWISKAAAKLGLVR